MPLYHSPGTVPNGWLAFDLSVLRRLKFRSVALPFTGEPELGAYLKRWGVKVAANDLSWWAWTKAIAQIENNAERLTEADVEVTLEDAYVPRERLNNPALGRWFNETDAWWLDNVRENIGRLDTQIKRALALSLGLMVGDYVMSFNEETRRLRQPLSLSLIFQRVWQIHPTPVNNSQRNQSTNREARDFIAEQQWVDLLFLRLPPPSNQRERHRSELLAWREEWLRGGDDFWDEMERARAGRLGSPVETKQQYLRFVEDILQAAAHLPAWAIAHTENGFISTSEIVETISRVRKVEAIYTKDFSELMGARATIITA